MAKRKVINALLANFLGSYVSRSSEYDGYYLFGFLVGKLGELRVNLLGECVNDPHSPMGVAVLSAVAGFEYQRGYLGRVGPQIREASLTIRRLPGLVAGSINGQKCTGFNVGFLAAVVMNDGKRHEREHVEWVAPHHAAVEIRSARAGIPGFCAPDFSERIFFPAEQDALWETRSIGWLGACVPNRGTVSPAALAAMNFFRRFHRRVYPVTPFFNVRCEICQDKAFEAAEFYIDMDGVRYILPSRILHYIENHGYAPPREFLEQLEQFWLTEGRAMLEARNSTEWGQAKDEVILLPAKWARSRWAKQQVVDGCPCNTIVIQTILVPACPSPSPIGKNATKNC